MKLNQVAHLLTEIVHAYMRERNINIAEFIDLDRRYNIIRFIETGYEPFHLTGTQGVIDEVDDYIHLQRDNTMQNRAYSK